MNIIAVNKRATFDYEILEKYDAGIELTGHEVKSAKMDRLTLTGAYAILRNNELFLVGAEIHSFQPKNAPATFDPVRTRRLLLKKSEINYLKGKLQSGLTLIPLKAYTNRGLVKLEIGLGKGMKKHDKRELIKKREAEREIEKVIKKNSF